MSTFWQIFKDFAVSSKGEMLQRIDKNVSVSSKGTTYITDGDTTVGSDGDVYVQMGDFSSDGSVRMGEVATSLGAVFNKDKNEFST